MNPNAYAFGCETVQGHRHSMVPSSERYSICARCRRLMLDRPDVAFDKHGKRICVVCAVEKVDRAPVLTAERRAELVTELRAMRRELEAA